MACPCFQVGRGIVTKVTYAPTNICILITGWERSTYELMVVRTPTVTRFESFSRAGENRRLAVAG
jgi:hypothetical protein